MTVNFPEPLGRADLTTTGVTTIYTVPGATKVQATGLILHNRHTTASVGVKVFHVLSGGSADTAAQFLDVTLAPRETVQFNPKGMATGDSIRAQADVANQATVQLEGIKES